MNGRSKGIMILLGALIVGVIAIPSIVSLADRGPQEWLDENYERVSGSDPDEGTVVYSSPDPLDETVADVEAGTDPDESNTGTTSGEASGAAAVYLRYGAEYIVRVSEEDGGARIELDEFDRGYNRYPAVFVGGWGTFYGKSSGGLFRGGGSGFGK